MRATLRFVPRHCSMAVCLLLALVCASVAYSVPPQRQTDCSTTCDLSIEECNLMNHCHGNARCEGQCHDEGVRCFNRCVRWLLAHGKLRR